MNKLVEVRVATYKRPQWLKWALDSLIVQDHQEWKAIVFDDSPDGEGEEVVESYNDSRLVYSRNKKNLGASENLNQCFETKPLLGGQYACVLEDDNWFFPDFISSNLQAIDRYNVNIVHRNQQVWDRTIEPPRESKNTTLRHRYTRKLMTPLQLHAHIFFFTGVSNGALFFKTNIQSQLKIEPTPDDPSIQEYLRCLAVKEDSVYIDEPKAAFAYMPLSATHRNYDKSKFFSAMIQASGIHLYRTHGDPLLKEAENIAKINNYNINQMHNMFANMFMLPVSKLLTQPKHIINMAKGKIKRVIFKSKTDPFF